MGLPTFASDARFDAEIQRREADEDRRVAEFKMNRDMAAISRPVGRPASEGSLSYMRDLMIEKAQVKGMDMGAAIESIDRYIAKGRTQAEVSANIDRLKAEGFTGRSKPAAGAADVAEVPAGHYAVEIADSEVGNDLAFYRVDRPTEGKWAGKVFVKMILGPEEQRLSWAATKTVLAQIAAVGPEVASARYGRETRKCGVCHRNLTNKASRERGIGPDCAAKLGW